jgi:hypothetical protein
MLFVRIPSFSRSCAVSLARLSVGVEKALRSINAAYEEWAPHLGNPNFCRQGEVLTWQARQRIWLRNEFDSSAYVQLAEARQYSFVVAEDGGLIQLHYEFAGDELLRASAGYYGSSQITVIERETNATESLELTEAPPDPAGSEPGLGSPELDPDGLEDRPTVLPEEGNPLAEIVEIIPSIRFDYTPADRRPYVHEHAHLHLPSFAQTRVAVSGFPSPQQFIELVFAWFYPDIYESRYQTFATELNPAAGDIDHAVYEPQYSRRRAERMRTSLLQTQSVDHPHLPMVRF